jgi:hypothetical protein
MIEDIILLLITGFAAARLTLIMIVDDIFEPVRHRLFMFSPPYNNETLGWTYQNWHKTKDINSNVIRKIGFTTFRLEPTILRRAGFFGRLFSCVDCLGVWVAAIMVGALALADGHPGIVLIYSMLAASMIVSLIGRRYM